MKIRFLLREMTLLLGLLSAVLSIGQDVRPLLLEKEIPLPGVEGRIDHFSVDVPGQRLFIAALENGSVEVLDIRQGERTAEIKGLEEPQGVYYDLKTGRLYVATGGDGKLRIYDEKSLTVRETLEFGGDADNVRYDRADGRHLGRLRERRNRNCELGRSKRRISRPWYPSRIIPVRAKRRSRLRKCPETIRNHCC